MSKQSLIVSTVVGIATLVVHGMFLCLWSEPAEARPQVHEIVAPATTAATDRPTLETQVATAAPPRTSSRTSPPELSAPRSARDSAPRSTASSEEASASLAGPARRYRVSPTLTSDVKVAKLIAIQADLDDLSHDIAMLGRLKGSLGAEKVEGLALRSTSSFLKLDKQGAVAFERAAKRLLENFRRAAVAHSRSRRAVVSEARETQTSPNARLRQVRAQFARDLQAAATEVRPLLGETQRGKVFEDQLGHWAEHLITTLR